MRKRVYLEFFILYGVFLYIQGVYIKYTHARTHHVPLGVAVVLVTQQPQSCLWLEWIWVKHQGWLLCYCSIELILKGNQGDGVYGKVVTEASPTIKEHKNYFKIAGIQLLSALAWTTLPFLVRLGVSKAFLCTTKARTFNFFCEADVYHKTLGDVK